MSKESFNRKESLKNILIPTAEIGLLVIASLSAFSRKTKRKIHERDGHKCVGCGATDNLEASHFNHNRNNPQYDDPSNGDTRCPSCHLEQHIIHAGNNGLSNRNNKRAIKSLKERVNRIESQ